jgi:hypothetical protein
LAFEPQSHGFRHTRLIQASVLGQSLSLVQPGGTGTITAN